MGKSAIEWTEETWNPITGCEKVSPGCDNCYAERVALNLMARGSARYEQGFTPTIHDDLIEKPLRWQKPRVVFVCSMSDLFQPVVPDATIHRVFDVMEEASAHTFQVLTKRPQRMASLLNGRGWVEPHIWVGTSIESNRYKFRADHLRLVNAKVRFLSCEPLLGPIPNLDLKDIGWVIVGGESGPEARPMDPLWVVNLRDRCVEEEIPFFFKQWGEFNQHGKRVGRKKAGKELGGRTWLEMPT